MSARPGLERDPPVSRELRIGTSPRPVMAARLIIPLETLTAAGWTSPW